MPEPAAAARRGRLFEVVLLAVAFVLVNLATHVTQKPYPFHDRQGWEGAAYLGMARQIANGQFPVVENAPEVYRLGTPALAGGLCRLTGWDLLACFRLVNTVADVLIFVFLVIWLRRFLADWRVRTALCLAFLLQWDTPVRWMYFFPPHTDPWMWAFVLAGLSAVERCRDLPSPRRIALVASLTVIGVCFREIVLVIALVLPFTGNPLRAGSLPGRLRDVLPKLVPLGAGVLTLAALRLVARRDNEYSFAWTALHYVFEKPWPTYLTCWFLAFGPILWLAIFRARRSAAFLAERQHLAVDVMVFAVLADMGGSDTERFLYWGMPVVYVLVGRALEDARNRWPGFLLVIFAAAQLVACRGVFWPAIAEYPNLFPIRWPVFTPFGRNIPFDELFTDTAPRLVTLVTLIEYLGFGAAMGIAVVWYRRHTRELSPDTGR